MIKQKIEADILKYRKARNKESLIILTTLLADIKNVEISNRNGDLSDDEVIKIVKKAIKSYNETKEEAMKGSFVDKVKEAEYAIDLISVYLPVQLSDDEAKNIIKTVLDENGITNIKQFGIAMKHVIPKLAGKYDNGKASKIIKEILS